LALLTNTANALIDLVRVHVIASLVKYTDKPSEEENSQRSSNIAGSQSNQSSSSCPPQEKSTSSENIPSNISERPSVSSPALLEARSARRLLDEGRPYTELKFSV
tara:strand:+ start:668 stop:982 length:315 start_codon:yes stop_codon:yes gene_type:complete